MATSERRPPPPPGVWRGLGLVAVLLLLASITAIGLISAGVFDPRPAGDVVNRRELTARGVGPGETVLIWLYEYSGADTFAARLTAAWAEGEQDVGYGATVGAEDDYLTAAVSPLGYAAVWAEQDGRREMMFPWQPWPHVRRGGEANEIQIEVSGRRVSVRVNRERLWEGERTVQGKAAGLYAQSFGQETVIDFQELVTFAPAGALTLATDSPSPAPVPPVLAAAGFHPLLCPPLPPLPARAAGLTTCSERNSRAP